MQSVPWYHHLIYTLPMLFGLFALWRLAVNSERVHSDLNEFKKRAKFLNSREELLVLRTELTRYYHSYCHCRQYGDHAREVCSYIDGKLAQITGVPK